MSVRETCADWIRGIEPHDDPALKGKVRCYETPILPYYYIISNPFRNLLYLSPTFALRKTRS